MIIDFIPSFINKTRTAALALITNVINESDPERGSSPVVTQRESDHFYAFWQIFIVSVYSAVIFRPRPRKNGGLRPGVCLKRGNATAARRPSGLPQGGGRGGFTGETWSPAYSATGKFPSLRSGDHLGKWV